MQGSKEKIALFDFCETLVSFQTADAFVRFVGEATGSARVSRMLRIHHFLDRKGIIGRLYKLFPESSPGKRLVARGLKGFREDALDELAGRYYAQRLRPALIPEVVGRLRSLQRDGWRRTISWPHTCASGKASAPGPLTGKTVCMAIKSIILNGVSAGRPASPWLFRTRRPICRCFAGRTAACLSGDGAVRPPGMRNMALRN